jgi:hypothetical protein
MTSDAILMGHFSRSDIAHCLDREGGRPDLHQYLTEQLSVRVPQDQSPRSIMGLTRRVVAHAARAPPISLRASAKEYTGKGAPVYRDFDRASGFSREVGTTFLLKLGVQAVAARRGASCSAMRMRLGKIMPRRSRSGLCGVGLSDTAQADLAMRCGGQDDVVRLNARGLFESGSSAIAKRAAARWFCWRMRPICRFSGAGSSQATGDSNQSRRIRNRSMHTPAPYFGY